MSAFEVSVVIPTYQHGHLLQRAVLSALQAGAAEVVIVDDCSTDNTETIGRGLAHAPQILYLRNPFHAGTIYSRNRAIYAANYELILPLDADDRLLKIAPLVDAWQPGHWVYGGWKELVSEKTIWDGKGTLSKFDDFEPPPPGMLAQKELGWVTMLFAKSDWMAVGGYDPDFSIGNEIWAFQRALVCAGVMPTRVPGVVFERNTDAPRTQRARAWAHLIRPLIDDKYPYSEVTKSGIIR